MKNQLLILSLLVCTAPIFGTQNKETAALYDSVVKMAVGPHRETDDKVTLDLKNLSLQSKLPSIGAQRTLYGTYFKSLFLTDDLRAVVDLQTLNALDVVHVKGDPEKGVSANIATKTQGGHIYKNLKLAFPSDTVPAIQATQAVVKTLAHDWALRGRISSRLERIQKAESQMLSFFEDEHPANKKLFDDLYFKKIPSLNNSTTLLNVGYRANNFHSLTKMLFGSDFLYWIGFVYSAQYYAEILGPKKILDTWTTSIPTILAGPFKALGSNISFVVENASTIMQNAPDALDALKNASFDQKCSIGAVGTILGIYGSILLHRGYQAYKQERAFNEHTKYMQERLKAVAEYVRCIQELDIEISGNSTLNENLHHASHLRNLGNKKVCTTQFAELIEILITNTFNGEPSFFSNKGRVLTAYRSMYAVKDEFLPALIALSELDTLVAVAELYAPSIGTLQVIPKKAGYTLVDCTDESATRPYISAQNFWNIHLDPSHAVVNSIEYGIDTPNALVITGINRGGKSTIFQSLTLNAILGQAFGIAAAQKWKCTPFAYISCYSEITSNVHAHLSTFEAEVARTSALYNRVLQLQENGEFGLLFIDEMFKGTEPEPGIIAVCAFSKKLASLPNILTTFVSHFKELAELAHAEPALFKNYSVAARANQDGSFTPAYRTSAGTLKDLI
jgi:hypothetical protein